MSAFRAGVDIGGTFTDVIFLGDDGEVLIRKIASTPDDYSRAVLEGVRGGIQELGIDAKDVTQVCHGFTVATNAILERKGVSTALITTAGFRDVLELRRNRVPRAYMLRYEKPPDLVERRHRFEVTERVNFQGEVLVPLDMADVEQVVERLDREKTESVAICLLHSYAYPEHEDRIARMVRERLPHVSVSVSSELLPEMREYERTSTTVINAYVRPVVERYLRHLSGSLQEMGVTVPLMVMQSNGGMSTVKTAFEKPVSFVESGPASGVIGAHRLGQRLGLGNVMSLDMGGTTAKASIIEEGQILRSPDHEVGGGMSFGHRLIKGTGYVVRVPSIDLAEVGAGGGSIARVDDGGSLQVGPQSAGAHPGPACYALGGDRPTVTDADVFLGYLNPRFLLGGSFPIDRDRAEEAIKREVASPLGLSPVAAAYGVHVLANSSMGRALRAVSSERGRDPRRFTLVAFGGGGPVHAASLAGMLGITRIVVPAFPGVFSALGLLFSDVEHHLVQTHFRRLSDLEPDALERLLEGLVQQGRDLLRAEGYEDRQQQFQRQADLSYVGQTSELTVSAPDGPITAQKQSELGEAFEREHERTYYYRSDEPLQLVNVRVIARGLSDEARVPERLKVSAVASTGSSTRREAYFGPDHGWRNVPVLGRADVNTTPRKGPVLVEEYDSTVVVPPDWTVFLGRGQELVMEHASLTNDSPAGTQGG